MKKDEPTTIPANNVGFMYNPDEQRFELLMPKNLPNPVPDYVIFMTGLMLKVRDEAFLQEITEWTYDRMEQVNSNVKH